MKSSIIYRPFQKEDTDALVAVIIDSWNYRAMFSETVAYHFASVFLYFALIQASFLQVAVLDGKPVGIIIGDIKTEQKRMQNYVYYLKLIGHGFRLLLSKEGRQVLNQHALEVSKVNEDMLSKQTTHFDAEVAIFAVSPKTQGLGVGSNLYQYFLDELKARNLPNYYLYTDTSCNYGFYDHKGLQCVSAVKHIIEKPVKKEVELYLYTGKVV